MSRESSSNLRFYCSKHAPVRKGFDGDPVTLIGKLVKIGFDAHHDGVAKEHMWVKVTGATREGAITGTLENDPAFVDGLHFGDVISLAVANIEDVFDGGETDGKIANN